MNYLIISREFPPQDGGIAEAAFEIANHLAKSGRKVFVLTWKSQAGKERSDLNPVTWPFQVMRISRPRNRWLQIAVLFLCVSFLVASQKIKRVYAMSWNFEGVAMAAVSWILPADYILFVHGYDISFKALSASDRSLLRFALNGARKIFANSSFTLELLLKHGPRKNAAWLPFGVDTSRFNPGVKGHQIRDRHALHGKKVLLTVARLFARKGHDQVIEAMPRIVQKIPDVRWVIAGTGPEKEKLVKRAGELKVQDPIVFAGFVPADELPAYYAACDVFVLPNREILDPADPWAGDFEGFGIVFIEAASTGKPVIAGRSGGAPDAVLDGQTGILVDPLNAAEIADAVIKILTDPALGAKMGQNGRRRAEQELTWPALLEHYEKAFEN